MNIKIAKSKLQHLHERNALIKKINCLNVVAA